MDSVFKKLHPKKHSPKKDKTSHKDKVSHKDKEKDSAKAHAGESRREKTEHPKKKSKDKEQKKEDEKKHTERRLSSNKQSKGKPPQPSSDQMPPDETEDNLDDNQNLIQLTPQASTPAPQQSTKRKDSKKRDKDKEHAGSEVPGTQSVTGKDATAKKKKKKEKKDVPENFVTLAKSIESKTVEDMCAEFKVNHKPGCEELNRDTRYVLTFNVPPDSDFYDASRVEMPGIDCKFIAAAAPSNDNVQMETFWRLVYDANVANIFYLEPGGKDFNQLAHFLPLEPTTSKDYGKMFVNNKKVERNPKEYQAVVEVLPEGCSNSIIVRFLQCRQWPDQVARKYRRIALHMVRTLKNEKSTSLIVCKDGRGRSGQFILLHSVISEVVSPSPDYKLKMAESLGALRQMRWGAIQTEQHYLLMYMLSLDFLVCKSKTFEPQARNLEKAILEYIKKQKDTAKAATPKSTKEKIEKIEKAEKAEKTEKTDKDKDKTEKDKDNEGKEGKEKEGKEGKEKEGKEGKEGKEKKKEPKEEKKDKEKEPDTVKQASEAIQQFGQKEPEKESGPKIVQSLYL